jgi:folylpolyglutamate synthase/dihydropteroate synthase
MERTRLRGRSVLLDAAHNVDSLRWLAHALGRLHPGRRLPVIFGCQSTRDPLELLRELQPVISTLTPVEIPVMHPCPVSEVIAAALELDIPLLLPSQAMPGALAAEYPLGANSELAPPDNSTRWQESVEHALDRAAGAPLVVCGSIYYLGEILRSFGA